MDKNTNSHTDDEQIINEMSKHIKTDASAVAEKIVISDDSDKNSDSDTIKMYKKVDFWGFFFDAPSANVTVDKNKIYYSGQVCESGIDNLIAKTRDVYKELSCHARELGVPKSSVTIELYINSPGGTISDGFRFIDFIAPMECKFKTIVLGQAASMGFVLWLLGDERLIAKNSHVLIHQLSSGFGGKHCDIMDYMKHLGDIQNQLLAYISERSSMTIKRIEELMSRETWLTSGEIINMGLGKLWEGK